MPEKRSATFRVQDGRIARSAQKWIVRQIQQHEEHVQVTIEPPKRSLAHNRFYWGQVITPITQGFTRAGFETFEMVGPTGEIVRLPVTKQFVHEWYKAKYLHRVDDEASSTTQLNDTQFSAYIELIRSDEDVLDAGVFIQEEGQIV